MNFDALNALTEKFETVIEAAMEEAGEDKIDMLLKRLEYVSNKSQFDEISQVDVDKLFDEAASMGPKTEYLLAYSMQYSMGVMGLALEAKGEEILQKMEEKITQNSDMLPNLSVSGYLFQRSIDILGSEANETFKSVAREFNDESFKTPEGRTVKNVMRAYKKAFKLG